MQERSRALVFSAIFMLVIAIAILNSVLFVIQGGFAGGHGRFDRILFLFGLPWVLIPWPESVTVSDYLRMILLPLGFDLAAIIVIYRWMRLGS